MEYVTRYFHCALCELGIEQSAKAALALPPLNCHLTIFLEYRLGPGRSCDNAELGGICLL